MSIFKLYETYEEAYFLERPNRFVMRLQTVNGKTILASVPNTGRMEEFCSERRPFFLTPMQATKYPYKVVATTYQNNFVFLDTIKVNALFLQLLKNNLIPQFQNALNIKREVTFGDSRFDFTFTNGDVCGTSTNGDVCGTSVIVEVKSCTLCHNKLAMFPDAPSLRAQKHLVTLDRLADETDYTTYVIFLILNASAERFLPNFHTDFDYGKLFLSANAVKFNAFRLTFIDPVSADLESIRQIPIDFSTTNVHCNNKGSYLLVLENPENRTVTVGKLGDVHFKQGWYVYAGSAMQGLDARIKRHRKKSKKRFWHIDYIATTIMKIKKVYPIRSTEKIESQLAQSLVQISDGTIKGCGASDTRDGSHLFYFKTFPLRNEKFVNIIFNAWTDLRRQ